MPDHDGDAARSSETEPAAFSNRRSLLRAGASGFALAASGLLLPAWLHTEAAAREGAYGGRLGGRHGKNRRGRDRNGRDRKRNRRDRDKKPDRDPPRGPFDDQGVRDIDFVFLNDNDVGTDPVLVTCYSYTWGTEEVVGEETKSVRAGVGADFSTKVKYASLYIDNERHVVWAKNPFYTEPTIGIAMTGGGLSTAGPKAMEVGATLSLQRQASKIDVKRLGDVDNFKVFTVTYRVH